MVTGVLRRGLRGSHRNLVVRGYRIECDQRLVYYGKKMDEVDSFKMKRKIRVEFTMEGVKNRDPILLNWEGPNRCREKYMGVVVNSRYPD